MWPPANLFCLLDSPGKIFCLENTMSHFNLRTINCSTVWLRRNSIQSYIRQTFRNSVLLLAVYCASELCHHIKSCLFFSRCTPALHNNYPFDQFPGNGTLVYSVLLKLRLLWSSSMEEVKTRCHGMTVEVSTNQGGVINTLYDITKGNASRHVQALLSVLQTDWLCCMFLIVFAWSKSAASSQPGLAGDSLLEQAWQTCQLRQCRWQNLPGLRRKNRIPSAVTWGDSTCRRSEEWNQHEPRRCVSAWTSKSGSHRSRRSPSLCCEKLKSVEVTKAALPRKPLRASVCISQRLSIIPLRQGWQSWWWDAHSPPSTPHFMMPTLIDHFQPFTVPIYN